ncbi:MAG: ABC transporter substrate-binding protein [Planctomycetota bacterium]
MRIVSLLPSATELVGLVGAGDRLVGRSHECDQCPGLDPAELAALPQLTAQRTSYNPSAGSDAAAIDAEVSASLAAGASLYRLDTDALAALEPDVILTQDLCDVCSIDLETVRAAAAAMPSRPRVVSLNAESMEEVLDDILRVGEAVDGQAEASAALVRLRHRLTRAQEYVNAYVEGPSLAFLEWTDPLFCGGHWTPQLIERAGAQHPLNPTVPGENAGAASGMQQGERRAGKSVRVPHELLIATQPDAIVVCPCGLTLAQTEDAVRRDLETRAWWHELPAVRSGRVALVDGNQMFNRPGPRLVDAFEWLVGWLQGRPALIPEGFPWKPWSAAP